MEIINIFPHAKVEPTDNRLQMMFEVRLGTYRREIVTLLIPKLTPEINNSADNDNSGGALPSKIYVSPEYMKDYSYFKNALADICNTVSNN
jgi:hypothetical protein